MAAPVAAAPKVKIQTFEEILAQVRSGSVPMQLPVMSGTPLPVNGQRPSIGSLYDHNGNLKGAGGRPWNDRSEVCVQPTTANLAEARVQCKITEEEGLAEFRRTGVAPTPRGPNSTPTGCMAIEQKYVEFIIGPMGQSLAALNFAAGVEVHLDQTRKFQGITIANIYGTEDCARRAKVALDFKMTQWLPRGQTFTMAAPIGAVVPPGEGEQPLAPGHAAAQQTLQATSFQETLMTRTPTAPSAPSRSTKAAEPEAMGGVL